MFYSKWLFLGLILLILAACTPPQIEDPAELINPPLRPTETPAPTLDVAANSNDFEPLPPTAIGDFPNPLPSLTPSPAVILTWRPNPGLPTELYQHISEGLNSNPAGFGVSYQPEQNPSIYSDKLFAEIASGTGPDVFWLPADQIAHFANNQLILNLKPMAANINSEEFYPGPIYQLSFDPATGQQGNALWGLPSEVDTLAIYLNLDLLTTANAPDPRQLAAADNWNWDTFAQVAEAANDPANGIYGYEQPWFWWSYGVWANAAGGGLITDEGSCGLTNPAGLVGFDFIHQLYQEQQVGAPYNSNDSLFLQGQAGMMLYSHALIPLLQDASFRWDVVELPAGPVSNGNWIFWGAYVVNAYSRHPQEAWQLVQTLTSATVQQQMVETGVTLSGRIDTLTTNPQSINQQAFLNGLHGATTLSPNWINGLDYDDFSCSAVTKLLNGEMSLADFSTNACNQFTQASITICP